MKNLISGFNPDADENTTITNKQSTSLQTIVNETNGQLNEDVNKSENAIDPLSVEEKFRIDRKKLEAMLQGNGCQETAENFFQRIMSETKATIIWPSKLKIGAKSKKDPHVKVLGLPEEVRLAREKIMANLDVKRSKVCLKIDVSYPDHSHLIGKRGVNIQSIMDVTKCQIHFPDSNRNSEKEKSNQVSISGLPDDVESARKLIRSSLPVTFRFDVSNEEHLRMDWSTIKNLAKDRYGVTINVAEKFQEGHSRFFRNNRTTVTTVAIKGCDKDASKAIDCCNDLLKQIYLICGKTFIPVSIVIDIAPHHHAAVKSLIERDNLQSHADIAFPRSEPRGPSIENSPVIITGSANGVYCIWKNVLNYLPALLAFDMSEETVQHNLPKSLEGIEIATKAKSRDGRITIILKGPEADILRMYNVREKLLLASELPQSGFGTIWNTAAVGKNDELNNGPGFFNVLTNGMADLNINLDARKDCPGNWNGISGAKDWPKPSFQAFGPNLLDGRSISRSSSSAQTASEFSCPSSITSSLSSPEPSPRFGTPFEFPILHTISENLSLHDKGIDDIMERQCHDLPRTSTPALPNEDAICTSIANSTIINGDLTNNTQSLRNRRFMTRSVDLDKTLTDFPPDYTEKRLLAAFAVQKQLDKPQIRVPCGDFAGRFCSSSMPAGGWRNLAFEDNGTPTEVDVTNQWNSRGSPVTKEKDLNNFAHSNFIDSSTLSMKSIQKCSTVNNVLDYLGLMEYVSIFSKQSIDLDAFKMLTNQDLIELEINKMGPRKKILRAIASLNSVKSISPAPGAERKFNRW